MVPAGTPGCLCILSRFHGASVRSSGSHEKVLVCASSICPLPSSRLRLLLSRRSCPGAAQVKPPAGSLFCFSFIVPDTEEERLVRPGGRKQRHATHMAVRSYAVRGFPLPGLPQAARRQVAPPYWLAASGIDPDLRHSGAPCSPTATDLGRAACMEDSDNYFPACCLACLHVF